MTEAQKEYEFAQAENRRLTELYEKMRWVGWASCVFGLTGLASLVMELLRSDRAHLALVLPLGVFSAIMLATGIWTYRSAGEFRSIVTTEGSDVSHLMNALDSLKSMYRLLYWVILAGVVIVLADASLGFLFPPEAI